MSLNDYPWMKVDVMLMSNDINIIECIFVLYKYLQRLIKINMFRASIIAQVSSFVGRNTNRLLQRVSQPLHSYRDHCIGPCPERPQDKWFTIPKKPTKQ